MAFKMTEKNEGNLIYIGDEVALERRAAPEMEPVPGAPPMPDGTPMLRAKLGKDGQALYKWVAYERVHTGVEFHEEHMKSVRTGAHRNEDGNVRHDTVKKMGAHPVIKENGKPIPTNEEFVWVPAGTFDSKDDAMAAARKLAGESK